MDKVFLRELKETDAAISWKWRNDPVIWKHTGSRPTKRITHEIELEWIKNVLSRKNEVRFAICEKVTDKYIGNVQLTHINGYDAQLHIFIGDKKSWGKGCGIHSTSLIVKHAFEKLHLQSVYLDVKKKNTSAIRTYEKNNFRIIFEYDEYQRMALYSTDDLQKRVSVFVMTYDHENFIRHALDGILMQQVNFNYEVVVGDDFSKDNTRAILVEYAIKNPGKFKLLFYPKNLSAPLNQHWVFKNCSANYIALCEGDDYWTDEKKLQTQVNFLEKNSDYSVCFHDIKMIDEFEKVTDDLRQPSHNKRDFDKYELFTAYLPTPTLLFRKFADELPAYFLHSVNGDALILAALTQSGKTKYLASIKPSVVRIHPGGVWSQRYHFEKWKSVLNTRYVIFKSLNQNTKKIVYDKYNEVFEMASADSDNLQLKKYWFNYNFRYLKFALAANHYGKVWLIGKRIFHKYANLFFRKSVSQ